MQGCAEGTPGWLQSQLGYAPRRAQVVARLAFWLAAFPGADNVVASIAICLYIIALTPGGALVIASTVLPPDSPLDAAPASAAALSSCTSSLGTLPRSRLLLPRLLYSVTRTSGRVFPANGMLSSARAASLLRLLAAELDRTTAAHLAGAAPLPAAPPAAPAPLPAPLLRLRSLLLHPSTLFSLCRTVALYAHRPGPLDPLTSLRSSSEATAALLEVTSACAASDEAAGAPCASPLAVASAALAVLGGEGGCCLTPLAAAALFEIMRNGFLTLPRSLDAMFRRLGQFEVGGDAAFGGPEVFFLVRQWGGATLLAPGVGAASAPSEAVAEEVDAWPMEPLGVQDAPPGRGGRVVHCQSVFQQCSRLLMGILGSQWTECLLSPPQAAGFQAAPCPLLAEHYLSALFNLFASSTLRLALTAGVSSGGEEPLLLGSLLGKLHGVCAATLARWGFVRAIQGSDHQRQLQLQWGGEEFNLRAVQAGLRIMDCPLSGSGMGCGTALCAQFFTRGGGQLFAALLRNWREAGAAAGGAGAMGQGLEQCALKLAPILCAHMDFPEACLGHSGCIATLLQEFQALAVASFARRPCADMQDPRYEALSLLASKAMPPASWGGALGGGGDTSGSWAALAAELMGVLDDALDSPAASAAAEGAGGSAAAAGAVSAPSAAPPSEAAIGGHSAASA